MDGYTIVWLAGTVMGFLLGLAVSAARYEWERKL